jgi:predicted PurR-regulated permease PerM
MSAATPAPGHRELVRAGLVVIATLALLQLLWQVRLLVLLTMLGVLLGIAVTPAVDRLERAGLKRGIAAPLFVLGLLALIVGVLALSGPTIVSQVEALRVQLPQQLERLDLWLAREHGALVDAVLPAPEPGATDAGATGRVGALLLANLGSLRQMLFGALSSTVAVAGGLVIVVFLTIYFAIAPGTYRRGVLLLVPPERRARGAQVFDAVVATLRKWLSTQLIAMVVIAVVTTTVLFVLGVKAAIPLGLLAGLFEFIPSVGPLISAVPALIIAFADGPSTALAVGLAYWGIQFLENNLLIPYLMQEELDLPPALTLLWQAVMALLFGFVGLFIAVPLLAALMVAVRMLYVRGDVPAVHEPRGSRMLMAVTDDQEDRTWM